MNLAYRFKGTGVALVTPFEKSGKIDLKSLEKLVLHVLKGGVDYLVPLGTTGESVTLSKEEKKEIVQCVVGCAKGEVPVLMGAGGNNTREVIRSIQEASDWKVEGILSVSPYYNKPVQAGILAHFKAIVSETALPLILYNVPGRTASNMTPETTLELASFSDRILGIKEASGNLEQFMAILQNKPAGFELISGDDNLTLPAISCGAAGVISVVANVFPEICSSMVRHALQGNFEKARPLHYALLNFVHLLFSEGSPGGAKAALSHLGIGGENIRLPLVPVSPAHREKIVRETERIGQLKF